MSELRAFQPGDAAAVLSWVSDAGELERWCGRTDHPLEASIFAAWHTADVEPFVLLEADLPAAYGEVWLDPAEDEVELGRLIVAPTARGRGVGRRLVEGLIGRAERTPYPAAYVRVHPENAAALRCYGATFTPVSEADQARFNRGQPRAYVWLRRPLR